MPFKTDSTGNIVTQDVNGTKLPVFVHGDGKEAPVDHDATLTTISRLNAEAKTHREAKEGVEKTLKAFEGLDAAQAREAIEKLKTVDLNKLVDKGELDKVRTEVTKAVEAQYAPFKTKAETLEQQLQQNLIGGVFAGSKFVSTKFAAADASAAAEIARALFAGRFKVEDGRVVGFDAQGNKLYSRTRPGELADAEEALEMIVDAYPHKASILKGSGASGGGAGGSGGGGAGGKQTITRAEFSKLTPGEQAAKARDKNFVITD